MIHFPGLLGAMSRVPMQWNLRAELPWKAGTQIYLGDGTSVIAYTAYIGRIRLVCAYWLLWAKKLEIKQQSFINK